MIRCKITRQRLDDAIRRANGTWFDDAKALLDALPATPSSKDFRPLWSKVKKVYAEIQHGKCCYCEKPLEGAVEEDVEHFRPKAEVKPWRVPDGLSAAGVVVSQPKDGSSEPGYSRLAYSPLNYGIACKVCNSALKRNYFPIEGKRNSAAADPTRLSYEKALLIYPIGDFDDDPEALIEFVGLSPRPKMRSGTFGHRRALVTIELFRLDDQRSKARSLFKYRAVVVRLLHQELTGRDGAADAAVRKNHEIVISNLTNGSNPFTSCLRSFEKLYKSDPEQARLISEACVEFMRTTSKRSGGPR